MDEKGVLTAKGTIKAEKGWIGGQNAFVIEDGKIYCRKNSLTSSTNGIYIGTDGIALGANNVLKLSNDGTFYAEKGYLGGTGGFVLERNKLYHGKSSISDDKAGIYLGTDGIALGANSVFKVTPQGDLTAKSGTIGGATIRNDSIRASNGNWQIDSDGKASFKNVFISGVRPNSSFGGVTYDGSTTYGGFSGGFRAGNSFGLDGGALSNFNDLVIRNITADYINTRLLKCENFIAIKGKVQTLETTALTADSAIIKDLQTQNISVKRLTADTVNGHGISWQVIPYISDINTRDTTLIKSVNFNTKEVTQDTVMVLTKVSHRLLYILCEDRGA